MGLFSNLFGNNNAEGEAKKAVIPWIPFTNSDQLEQIRLGSAHKPQFIYKHSTSCGISCMVLRVLEGTLGASEPAADFFFLDLHRYRELSRAVAAEFRIPHESPQLLIVKDGHVRMAASHGAIAEINFKEYM